MREKEGKREKESSGVMEKERRVRVKKNRERDKENDPWCVYCAPIRRSR
tara:strand:+ start:526 stop:672 length:147 start_codon:yes stop_codon:yes gene_type:complete